MSLAGLYCSVRPTDKWFSGAVIQECHPEEHQGTPVCRKKNQDLNKKGLVGVILDFRYALC